MAKPVAMSLLVLAQVYIRGFPSLIMEAFSASITSRSTEIHLIRQSISLSFFQSEGEIPRNPYISDNYNR